jgi:hypothetical protein
MPACSTRRVSPEFDGRLTDPCTGRISRLSWPASFRSVHPWFIDRVFCRNRCKPSSMGDEMSVSSTVPNRKPFGLLERAGWCVVVAIITFVVTVGAINLWLTDPTQTAARWQLESSKAPLLQRELWLRYMIPPGGMRRCFVNDAQVCRVADMATSHLDFYGRPSEGVDLSYLATIAVCGVALVPTLIALGITLWLTRNRPDPDSVAPDPA